MARLDCWLPIASFSGWLTRGVQVYWQQNGETQGDRVQIADFADPEKNDWLVVNQFTVTGTTPAATANADPMWWCS